MIKRRIRNMIFGVLLIVVCIGIYLTIPYSPVKKEFWDSVTNFTRNYQLPKHEITNSDLKPLPKVLQNYFIRNNYVGIESTSAVIFQFKGADFTLGINKPNIKIDYTAYDFVKEPTRLALIDSKINGINRPTNFQAIWNFKSGDLIYFNSNNMKFLYK